MKLLAQIIAVTTLATSALGAPVVGADKSNLEARNPQGSFIWDWAKSEGHENEKRTPQGSFIWDWAKSEAHKNEKRTPQGSFIWDWAHGTSADHKSTEE
ncbi:hypothetical protein MAJ_09815, partial [Metarhizium majus ARSEF 297]